MPVCNVACSLVMLVCGCSLTGVCQQQAGPLPSTDMLMFGSPCIPWRVAHLFVSRELCMYDLTLHDVINLCCANSVDQTVHTEAVAAVSSEESIIPRKAGAR